MEKKLRLAIDGWKKNNISDTNLLYELINTGGLKDDVESYINRLI